MIIGLHQIAIYSTCVDHPLATSKIEGEGNATGMPFFLRLTSLPWQCDYERGIGAIYRRLRRSQ